MHVPKGGKPGGLPVSGRTLLTIFLVLYYIAGAVLYRGIRAETLRSRKYSPEVIVQVPCVIQVCEYSHQTKPRHRVYHKHYRVRFAYAFEGRHYVSEQFSPASRFISSNDPLLGGRDGLAAILERYKAGTETICLLNPSHPADAVLMAGPPLSLARWLRHPIVLMYVAIPLLLLLVVYERRRKRRQMAQPRRIVL